MPVPSDTARDASAVRSSGLPARPRAYLLFAGLHLLTALAFLLDRAPGTRAALDGLPVDDAWIHLVYARSFAHLHGFAYNPGQQESGFTSPLWVLALTPAVWLSELGLPIVLLVKLVGLALGFVASVLCFELLLLLTKDARPALLSGVLVALDPWLSFAKLSGMEVLLAPVTVLWTLVELARGRLGRAGVALALCGLARPENAVFVGPALAWLVWARVRRGDGARGVATAVLPTALAGGAWLAFCLAVTGRPLPNTFYAKHPHKGAGAWLENLEKLGHMLQYQPGFTFWVCVALFVAGAVLLVRGRSWREPSELPLRLLVVAHPLLFLLGVVWAHSLGDENAFYWSRYFQPAIPFLLLPLSVGMGFVGSGAMRAVRRQARPGLRMAGVVALALVALVLFQGLVGALRDRADLFAWNCQNIEEMQVALGRWLAGHTAPGDWIAANDAGAIRYVSDRPVVDLTGLNQHEVLFGRRREVLDRLKPKLYAVFPSWFPELMRERGFHAVHRVRAERYTICDCEQEEVVVLAPPSGG